MNSLVNIYCDESCHLENDQHSAMVFGAIWVPDAKKQEVSTRIAEIRARHNMPAGFEIKWTKVGPGKIQLYLDLIDYFFDEGDVHFRCLVIPDKTKIDHKRFAQEHDDWYYKMYFNMLKVLLKPQDTYRIYLDIKDTRSELKVRKLHEVLCNSVYDFSRDMIQRVQQVRSHEVVIGQLADLLIGAMAYKFRGETGSSAKLALIDRISKRSGYSLDRNTLLREDKFNIFVWRGSED